MKIDLLIRILGMLGSSNDAEVLNAARKANAMVTEAGTTWGDLLGGVTVKTDAVEVATADLDITDQIRKAFTEIGDVAVATDATLFSLRRTFEASSYLSPAERRPLFDAVKRKRARA